MTEAEASTDTANTSLSFAYDASGLRTGKTVTTHTHEYAATVIQPTCTEGGYTVHTCACGDSYQDSETDPLGHSYTTTVVEPTCTQSGYTFHACTACGHSYSDSATNPLGHHYAKTGEDSNYVYYACTRCGDSYTEAHVHSYTVTVVEPTCTEGGYTNHVCSGCGHCYQDNETDALGHNYVESSQETYTCTRCGDSYTVHSHSYTATVVEPTCTESGYTLYTCACGHSYQDNVTAALGHSYTATVVEPTCTEGGYTLYTCSSCGDSYQDNVTAALGHSYTTTVVEPTCTEDGYTLHECACGDSYQDNVTAALGHSYTTREVEPTCTEEGYTLHECACGYSYRTDEVNSLGHDYRKIREDGENAYFICTRCGDTHISPIHILPTEPNPPVVEYSLELEEEAVEANELLSTVTEEHSYIYASGMLLRETITSGNTTETLDFRYDNVGYPYALIYNNGSSTATYYYITNLQGDVMYLVDSNGNQVAAYTYDPYGKILSATGTMAEINPLRYRGYYYDSETGFYYLQSRYYDPNTCRFINADSYASTGQGLMGYNMFAYCNNNPIINADPTGHSVILTGIIVGAVIGAVVGGYAGAKISEAKTGEVNGWAVAGGAVAGGIVGGLIGWGVGTAISTFGTTAVGAATAPAAGQIAEKASTAIQTYYPPNNGFSGTVEQVTLEVGTILQRTGDLAGRFVAPAGTPIQMLSLPYDKAGQTTILLEVTQPIQALCGRVAPWFGQIGGGIQYLLLDGRVDQLILEEIIKSVGG